MQPSSSSDERRGARGASWRSEEVALSAPYNWCDARCERCPLGDCRFREAAVDGRELAGAPDELDAILDQIGVDRVLGDAGELLRLGIRRPAADPREPTLPPAAADEASELETLTCKGLVRAATRYVEEVRQARLIFLPERSLPAEVALEHAVLLFVTIGRFAGDVTVGEALADDALDGCHHNAANLLLLDQLDRQTAAALQQAAVADEGVDRALEPFWAARRALRRQLDPWLGQVPGELQRRIGELVAAGRAPSPFCVARGEN